LAILFKSSNWYYQQYFLAKVLLLVLTILVLTYLQTTYIDKFSRKWCSLVSLSSLTHNRIYSSFQRVQKKWQLMLDCHIKSSTANTALLIFNFVLLVSHYHFPLFLHVQYTVCNLTCLVLKDESIKLYQIWDRNRAISSR